MTECRIFPRESCPSPGACLGGKPCYLVEETKRAKMSLAELMASSPEHAKDRWCEASACFCTGCANWITKYGHSKADWEKWRDALEVTDDHRS